ncbi:uncharacterized mitochondrial protein AtMg00310-like [Raphanus sativus]|uniref:Uncharacterized mitochondrial protein AtMg00310-like n=1 Tax=Raphanus sativus TaxID=3726 RepID=A0A6J0LGN8_RAPSA|nr:uncharacterized mitochondrial protein AtMg00310-like [Raphanus sativus]
MTQGRLDGWYFRKWSQAGKEVFLKSKAASLPVFAMSCFRLPKTVISKLSSIMSNFWWSSDEGAKKIHWIAWEWMCLLKSFGGMGFKDLESFNQALLAKQGWRLVNQPESLLARFLKSRYFPHENFLSAIMGTRPSFAWRSLLYGRELLSQRLKQEIGNGKDTKVWLDKWIDDPQEGLRPPWRKNHSFDVNLMVSSLINPDLRRWNLSTLQEIFVPGDIELILKRQPVVGREDFQSWKFHKKGTLTEK